MYNNILHKAPVLKPNVSNAGRELLEGLLQKDRTKRLGVKDDFVSVHSWSLSTHTTQTNCLLSAYWTTFSFYFVLQLEIKYHSFFSPINWEDLMAKKITPPFIPSVVSLNEGCNWWFYIIYWSFCRYKFRIFYQFVSPNPKTFTFTIISNSYDD